MSKVRVAGRGTVFSCLRGQNTHTNMAVLNKLAQREFHTKNSLFSINNSARNNNNNNNNGSFNSCNLGGLGGAHASSQKRIYKNSALFSGHTKDELAKQRESARGNTRRNAQGNNNNNLTGFEQLMGSTPLVYLSSISELAGCHVYGKCEFLNPCGSLKDRTAFAIIETAEKQGELVRGEGGIIVEGTTGNTGTAVSAVSCMLGYTPVIVVPSATVSEKKQRLRYYGGNLIEVPNVDSRHINHFHSFAKRLSQKIKEKVKDIHVIYSNQHDNVANYKVHYQTTGPEIWRQTNGKVTVFSSSMGTAGSIAGISKYLQEQNSNVRVCLTDPMGGYIVNYCNKKNLTKNGESICEGTPGTRAMVSKNMKNDENELIPTWATEVPDKDMVEAMDLLQKKEGLIMGLSSGVNCAGAIKVAKHLKLGKDDVIVTMLCDLGDNYISKVLTYKEKQKTMGNKSGSTGSMLNPTITKSNGRKEEEEGIVHPFEKGSVLGQCVEDVFQNGLEEQMKPK